MSSSMDAVPAALPAAFPVVDAAEAEAHETHELTSAELHAALSELGHNREGEVVMTRCTLSSKHLSRLPGLERYSNLQQLTLDSNALTELTAVQHMPQLVYLSARHNQLTSDVFESLAGAAECLERLHLDDNCLTSLSGLEALPYITDLSCSENKIECISSRCLSAAQRLMRLRLGHNCISSIDVNAFDAARYLRLLELDHNALTDVGFLHSVSAQLERLLLADNRISHLDNSIQHLAGLTTLDIRQNVLQSLDELQVLRSLRALRVLFFDGNEGLTQLPQPLGTLHQVERAVPAPPAGRTEYHAEVVMSDEEGEEGGDHSDLRAFGAGTSSNMNERSRTINPTSVGVAEDHGVLGEANLHYSPSCALGSKNGGDRGDVYQPDLAVSSGITQAATAAAAPTTAAYVVLAAPETHEFVRTVGNAARDAVLSVRVDNTEEVLALPVTEQVYLWTLSVLPHLQELNGQLAQPADVARAKFLFSTNVNC
jgi:hypothetical protein